MKLKRISAILAIVLAFASLFAVMAVNSSAATDIVIEDYGLTIPAADQTGNFVAYGQKPGTDTWTKISNWGGLRTGFLNNATAQLNNEKGAYEGGTVFGYMNADVSYGDSDYFKAGMQIDGTFVFDLGGHTLKATNAAQDRIIGMPAWKDRLYGDTSYKTTIVIQNGTIYTEPTAGNKLAVVDIWTNSESIYSGEKSVEIIFNNVTFKSNTTGTYRVVRTRDGFKAGQSVALDLAFNNCVFDCPNTKELKIFDDGSSINAGGDEAVKSNLTVNGCKFNVNNGEKFVIFNGKTENDSLVLDPTTTLKMPVAATAPSVETVYNIDGVEFVFVKGSEADGFANYVLKEKEVVNFVPKTSITLSNALIYNVYVPVSESIKALTLDGVDYSNLADPNVVTLSDGKQYYRFEIELPSPNAARDVVLTATLTVGAKELTGSWTMNVPKYAAKVIANGTDVEKTLAKDVLAYVKAAYNYFADYNTAEEIARVNALIDSIIGDYTAAPTISGTVAKDNSGIVTDVTLNLDAKPTIRFYVTDTNVEFKIGNRVLETVKDADGKYVELDVNAYALAETITFGDGGSYHISDFVNGSVGTSHEALVNAFAKYVESAAAYRNSVINK